MKNACKDDLIAVCSVYEDLPAAHSMDTEWFAVDADGHIAIFDSGEAGAVPGVHMRADSQIVDAWCSDLPRQPVRFTPNTQSPHVYNTFCKEPVMRGEFIFFVRSAEVAREILRWPASFALCSSVPHLHAVYVLDPKCVLVRDLHRDGHCISCTERQAYTNPLMHRGLYMYEHSFGGSLAQPYTQITAPLNPLHIDTVSPDIRDKIRSVHFEDLRFQEACQIQPAQRVEDCGAWSEEYVTEEGEVRSLD